MKLTHLSLTNFRNFARLDIDVPYSNVLIVGQNAQGKTSILEAIYLLASMTSFQAGSGKEMVNFIEGRKPLAVGRVVGTYEREGRQHKLEIRIIKERNRLGVERTRKEVLLDGNKKKLTEVVGHFSSVLFLPQMMTIVEGSPSERRRYLDLAISQVNNFYATTLNEYNKLVQQRNALLKKLFEHKGDASQLDFWDNQIAEKGAALIYQRIEAIRELEQKAALVHHELTHGAEVLRLDYVPAYDPHPEASSQEFLLDVQRDRSGLTLNEIETGFRTRLAELRREEINRGTTSIGPHRDEIRFLSNGVDLGTYGSRGQVRTTLLTLKMAEVQWIEAKTKQTPILLLDEVLAELDEYRRADLLGRLSQWPQTLMTTTDLGLFADDFVNESTIWPIANGAIG